MCFATRCTNSSLVTLLVKRPHIHFQMHIHLPLLLILDLNLSLHTIEVFLFKNYFIIILPFTPESSMPIP